MFNINKFGNDAIKVAHIGSDNLVYEYVSEYFNGDSYVVKCYREVSACLGEKSFDCDIYILDLVGSVNITEIADIIANSVANNALIIAIISPSDMKFVNVFRSKGIHSISWVESYSYFSEVIDELILSRRRGEDLSNKRRSKRIFVLGSKGGVGVSSIACQLVSSLGAYGQSVIATYDIYCQGSSDVLLGNIQEKRSITAGVADQPDELLAHGLLTKISETVHHLNITSSDFSYEQAKEYLRSLLFALSEKNKFIIEEYRHSSFVDTDILYVVSNVDFILLILEPSFSSVREVNTICDRIENAVNENAQKLKIVTVLNYSRPEKFSELSLEEVTSGLERKIDFIIPFSDSYCKQLSYKSIDNVLLNGVSSELTNYILGERHKSSAHKTGWLFNRWWK